MIVQVGRHAVGRIPGMAAILTSAVVWVVLLGPLVVLLTQVSPHSIRVNLDQPGALDPLWISLEASAIALGCMVVLGTPLAYLLARGRLRFARVIEAGIILPLLMPPLVIGLLLIFLLGQAGPVGRVVSSIDPNVFGVNTFFALVVAEFYEAAPYYIITATAALATVDERLEQDAQLLGDRPLSTFRRITLPLAAPGLATGLAIALGACHGRLRGGAHRRLQPGGPSHHDRSDLHRQWPRRVPGLCPAAHRGGPSAATDRVALERPGSRTQDGPRRREPRPMTPTPMLDADFVVARRSFDVVARLCLAPGERLSLFGASGSGKTTCLEAIAGSVALKRGRIWLDGRLVNAARERWARGS